MNTKKFSEALGEIDTKYVDKAISYKRNYSSKNNISLKKLTVLIAAVIGVLTLSAFAMYECGFFDPWLQKVSADPIQTVQSAIEGQADKEYTISVRIDNIEIDEIEIERVVERYSGSELAAKRGWTDEYLKEHFLVVKSQYYVEYDHTKTFLEDGYTEQYFYLTQDMKTGEWQIVDNTSPNTSAVE